MADWESQIKQGISIWSSITAAPGFWYEGADNIFTVIWLDESQDQSQDGTFARACDYGTPDDPNDPMKGDNPLANEIRLADPQ